MSDPNPNRFYLLHSKYLALVLKQMQARARELGGRLRGNSSDAAQELRLVLDIVREAESELLGRDDAPPFQTLMTPAELVSAAGDRDA